MKKHYETATWGDGVLSIILPFWGILIGLNALVFRKEKRRGTIMICLGLAMMVFVVLEIFVAGSARAKGYHYHAPKQSTYHAPKTTYSVPVRGYIKRDGTYVMPAHRTGPDSTRVNNWSSKPNVNPYTGKPGTKDPHAPKCCGT